MTVQELIGKAERKKLDEAELLGVLTSAETPCPDCEGKGEIVNFVWSGWNIIFNAAKAETQSVKLALEKAGPYPEGPEMEPCRRCKGSKFIPTDDGRRLLAFLERQGIRAVVEGKP